MEYLIYIYLFILGALLGSFYNVVGLRITKGESIIKPRSYCPKCGHVLSWWELIPIFSYIFLVGKCHKCKAHISTKYPFFELITALLFIFSYYKLGFSLELLVCLVFVSLLIIISISDLEYMIIEDKVIIFFLLLILILRIFIKIPHEFSTFNINSILESLIGGIFGFGLLFIIAFIGQKVYKQEVMGGGDIKLYGIIGLILGLKMTLISLFFASIIGTILGILLINLKVLNKEKMIPFGPFIAIGSLVTYFYGYEIINWYLNLLYLR